MDNGKLTGKILIKKLLKRAAWWLVGILAYVIYQLSFRNPQTNELETGVNCIIPEAEADFYTIQINNVMYNAGTLTFTEL